MGISMEFKDWLMSEFVDHFKINKPKNKNPKKRIKKTPPPKTFKLLVLNEKECPFDRGYPESYYKAIHKDSLNEDYQTTDGLMEFIQDTCGQGLSTWEDNFGRYHNHLHKRSKHPSLEETERKQLKALRWIYLRVELRIIYYT